MTFWEFIGIAILAGIFFEGIESCIRAWKDN